LFFAGWTVGGVGVLVGTGLGVGLTAQAVVVGAGGERNAGPQEDSNRAIATINVMQRMAGV